MTIVYSSLVPGMMYTGLGGSREKASATVSATLCSRAGNPGSTNCALTCSLPGSTPLTTNRSDQSSCSGRV